MKKRVLKWLTKAIAAVLAVGILFSCLHILDNQATISPENPITQQEESLRFPIAQSANIVVDRDNLDTQPDIEQAEREHLPDSIEIPPIDVPLSGYAPGDGDDDGDGDDNSGGGDGHSASETSPGSGDPGGEHGINDGVPGGDAFELPADSIFFYFNLIDVQNPYYTDDSRCFYAITHVFPQLEVENIVLLINNEPTLNFYDASTNRDYINLQRGENWIRARITYRFPDGTAAAVTAAANPPMVVLQDPLDIDFSDTNLQSVYEDPVISFYVRPRPEHARIQVFVNERQIPIDGNGNYNVRLQEGENWVTFRGTARGYNDTEVTRRVIYRLPRIRIHSPELEALDFRRTGRVVSDRNVIFSVSVEFAETGQPVHGALVDIEVNGVPRPSLVGAFHSGITIPLLPSGENIIVIRANGANENNSRTASGEVAYRIFTSRRYETPPQIVIDNADPHPQLPEDRIVRGSPVWDFKMSPVAIDTRNMVIHAVTEHKQHVSHTSIATGTTIHVPLRQNMMGVYYYRMHLIAGRNVINVVLVTDEGYRVPFEYEIFYIPPIEGVPQPSPPAGSTPIENIGSIFITVDAAVLGIPFITGGDVDINKDEPLSFAVLRLLQQSGYQAVFDGTYSTAMYLRQIIRPGMMAAWNEDRIPATTWAAIEAAGGDSIWHGDYKLNSLGDEDFTIFSGWIFTINNRPISGLSTTYPKDGDTVRMSFTLTGFQGG